MANLKEIRSRIKSVSSTSQITSAMKMVSASKLRRAQDAITQMRPYAEKLLEILSNLCSSLDSSEGVYSEEREVNKVLIIAINSNRGLCGAFNSFVIKSVNKSIKTEYTNAEVSVLAAGKKAADFFNKTSNKHKSESLPENLNYLYGDLSFENVAEEAQKIMDTFVNKEFDKVVMVYNRFKNAAVQVVTTEQLLPVLPLEISEEEKKQNKDYIFEPNKGEIVQELIPKSLKTQLYKAMLDSNASEHGARMTAMHKATDNANELVKELKLKYNKARQAAITNEILEIVGGAEALKG